MSEKYFQLILGLFYGSFIGNSTDTFPACVRDGIINVTFKIYLRQERLALETALEISEPLIGGH